MERFARWEARSVLVFGKSVVVVLAEGRGRSGVGGEGGEEWALEERRLEAGEVASESRGALEGVLGVAERL